MSELCVIFDMDGTLVDSEGLCSQAFLDLLPQLNVTLEALIKRFRGRQMAPVLQELERILGAALPDNFEREARAHMSKLFASHLQPMPGVREMLAQFDRPRCIASSGPRAKIQDGLTVTGLLPYFEGRIFSAYEVGAWKPEPHLFLHAAQAMGFAPTHCVVVEDSTVGVEAARAAGMFALQFLPDLSATLCATAHPETHPYATIFHDMAELPALLNQRAQTVRDGGFV